MSKEPGGIMGLHVSGGKHPKGDQHACSFWLLIDEFLKLLAATEANLLNSVSSRVNLSKKRCISYPKSTSWEQHGEFCPYCELQMWMAVSPLLLPVIFVQWLLLCRRAESRYFLKIKNRHLARKRWSSAKQSAFVLPQQKKQKNKKNSSNGALLR